MERRGMDRKKAEAMIEGLYSDPEAQYAHVIELDAAEITRWWQLRAIRETESMCAS